MGGGRGVNIRQRGLLWMKGTLRTSKSTEKLQRLQCDTLHAIVWVAVKELKISYHNGNMKKLMRSPPYSNLI